MPAPFLFHQEISPNFLLFGNGSEHVLKKAQEASLQISSCEYTA